MNGTTMPSKRDGGGGVLSLPEDNVLEVLLRLPAKALCRFRCVCKAWHALISDPAFVAAQRSRATGPLIVAMFGSMSTERHEVRLLDKGGNILMVFDVMGGSTALLAQTHLNLIFIDRRDLGGMIIDPASGQSSTVFGTKDPMPLPWWANLRTSSDYSFGRATPSGDYKVLHISVPRCEVATVVDGGVAEPATWRQRPWGPMLSVFPCADKATVNGVLYFMPFVTYRAINSRNSIASFDLESEAWKAEMIKGPRLGCREKSEKWSITLAELKGTLCMVHNVQHLTSLGGHYANIWLLIDPSRGIWVKEYTIQMPGELLLFSKPLDVLDDGSTLLLLNMFWKAGSSYNRYVLQLYNSHTETITDFMEMTDRFNGGIAFYTGSLLR